MKQLLTKLAYSYARGDAGAAIQKEPTPPPGTSNFWHMKTGMVTSRTGSPFGSRVDLTSPRNEDRSSLLPQTRQIVDMPVVREEEDMLALYLIRALLCSHSSPRSASDVVHPPLNGTKKILALLS